MPFPIEFRKSSGPEDRIAPVVNYAGTALSFLAGGIALASLAKRSGCTVARNLFTTTVTSHIVPFTVTTNRITSLIAGAEKKHLELFFGKAPFGEPDQFTWSPFGGALFSGKDPIQSAAQHCVDQAGDLFGNARILAKQLQASPKIHVDTWQPGFPIFNQRHTFYLVEVSEDRALPSRILEAEIPDSDLKKTKIICVAADRVLKDIYSWQANVIKIDGRDERFSPVFYYGVLESSLLKRMISQIEKDPSAPIKDIVSNNSYLYGLIAAMRSVK